MSSRLPASKRNAIIADFTNGVNDPEYEVIPSKTIKGKYTVRKRKAEESGDQQAETPEQPAQEESGDQQAEEPHEVSSSPRTVEASSSSACWLSTTNFVNTKRSWASSSLKLNSKITQINIVYSVKDIVEDKLFIKFT